MSRVILASLLLFLTACNSISVTRQDIAAGSVLVLPPRDVVQDGQPHERGADTGKKLQQYVVAQLRATQFAPLETDAPGLTHTSIAARDAALDEAGRVGATYCLQLVLGEFLDAAPFTFRTDFVTLEQGTMWATATGEVVWQVNKPYTLAKSNLGGIDGLLGDIAEEVVGSIAR